MSFLFAHRKTHSDPTSRASTPRSLDSDAELPERNVPMAPPLLSGHSGHLTAAQQEALKVFTEKITSAGLYTPPTKTLDASHDEPTLLRFLRARAFHPDAALEQFRNAEKWRKLHDVDNLYATGFTDEEFEDAKRFYPRWTGRRDRQGVPLYVYRIASLQPIEKELDAIPAERRYQRIVGLYEFMTQFTFPLCTHLPHPSSPTPISSTTSIIDLSSASLTSLFRLRSHLQEASKLAQANYPETLGSIVIANSPSFFPTVWGWVRGWFDEVTRNKIHVLGKDKEASRAHLLSLIDPKDLPKAYGGDLDWEYQDEPNLDEAAKQVLGEMPKGPVIFNLRTGRAERPTPASSSSDRPQSTK